MLKANLFPILFLETPEEIKEEVSKIFERCEINYDYTTKGIRSLDRDSFEYETIYFDNKHENDLTNFEDKIEDYLLLCSVSQEEFICDFDSKRFLIMPEKKFFNFQYSSKKEGLCFYVPQDIKKTFFEFLDKNEISLEGKLSNYCKIKFEDYNILYHWEVYRDALIEGNQINQKYKYWPIVLSQKIAQ